MRRIGLFTLIFILLFPAAALAADAQAKPILKQATINVDYTGDAVEITEDITLSNSELIKGGKVEHLVTQFPQGKIESLILKAEQQELKTESQKGNLINKLQVFMPQGTKGDFNYKISYRYSGDLNRLPIVLPSIPSSGNGNVILFKVNLPEGKYLGNSFPLLDDGSTGVITKYMMNIPSYLELGLKDSAPGFFTLNNMYSLLGLVIILGIIGLWLVGERRTKRGGVTHV